MIKRSLQEIQSEIKSHKEAIKLLENEVKSFQELCPHPDTFEKVDRKSYYDEYGTLDGCSVITTCLLCGHNEYKNESSEQRVF